MQSNGAVQSRPRRPGDRPSGGQTPGLRLRLPRGVTRRPRLRSTRHDQIIATTATVRTASRASVRTTGLKCASVAIATPVAAMTMPMYTPVPAGVCRQSPLRRHCLRLSSECGLPSLRGVGGVRPPDRIGSPTPRGRRARDPYRAETGNTSRDSSDDHLFRRDLHAVVGSPLQRT